MKLRTLKLGKGSYRLYRGMTGSGCVLIGDDRKKCSKNVIKFGSLLMDGCRPIHPPGPDSDLLQVNLDLL